MFVKKSDKIDIFGKHDYEVWGSQKNTGHGIILFEGLEKPGHIGFDLKGLKIIHSILFINKSDKIVIGCYWCKTETNEYRLTRVSNEIP